MSKYLKVGIILSVGWWAVLVYNQLTSTLVCTPTDDFCNSGNTATGDVIWGTIMAFTSLALIWSTIAVFILIKRAT